MADREVITCEVCNRALYVEDGPICPDCRPQDTKPAPKPSKADDFVPFGDSEAAV